MNVYLEPKLDIYKKITSLQPPQSFLLYEQYLLLEPSLFSKWVC